MAGQPALGDMHLATAIILAAGDHLRWKGVVPKQLANIHGETILGRQVRQLLAAGYRKPTIITHHPEFITEGAVLYDPPLRRWTVESLESSRLLWCERTIVLLGDVVFSEEALKAVTSYASDCCFFGKDYEIYALSFIKADKFDKALADTLGHARQGGRGGIWELYRAYNGLALDRHIPPTRGAKTFVHIDDWTTDFDYVEQYKAFVGDEAYAQRH